MDLQNALPHMRGKSIMVNGTTYVVDAHGVARDVADGDADKLLRRTNGAWRVCIERQPVRGGEPTPEPDREDTTVPNVDASAVLAAQDQFEARKRGEANPAPSEAAEGAAPTGQTVEKQEPTAPTEDAGTEPGGPKLDPSMAIEDLRQMADAYQVTYTARTSKETLLKRLQEALKE